MWLTKKFNTYGQAASFKADMIWRGYKANIIFIHNGYAVEYKRIARQRRRPLQRFYKADALERKRAYARERISRLLDD